MKPITHQEAQQLAQNALGSFSYFLPSGEQFTAWQCVTKLYPPKGKFLVFPARDEVVFADNLDEVLQ